MINKTTFGPGELYRVLPDGTKKFVRSITELTISFGPRKPNPNRTVITSRKSILTGCQERSGGAS